MRLEDNVAKLPYRKRKEVLGWYQICRAAQEVDL